MLREDLKGVSKAVSNATEAAKAAVEKSDTFIAWLRGQFESRGGGDAGLGAKIISS